MKMNVLSRCKIFMSSLFVGICIYRILQNDQFVSHVYTVQQTSRHLKEISTNANVKFLKEKGMISLSNHIKVLNVC